MLPDTMHLEIHRLRHQERITAAERRRTLLRNPMTPHLPTLVHRAPKEHTPVESPQVARVA